MVRWRWAGSAKARSPARDCRGAARARSRVSGSTANALKCAEAARTIAIRAGRLFDSNAGKMLTNQVVLINGERITEVGPAAQVRDSRRRRGDDLSRETVLPGLIDAHTHMFNEPKPGMSRETSTLIAIQHAQDDLRAGFTTLRDMTQPRQRLCRRRRAERNRQGRRRRTADAGLDARHRVVGRGERPAEGTARLRCRDDADEARAAVRDQIEHGADWIKLYPGGRLLVHTGRQGQYVLTYPMPVLQALIDETHRLGKKTACHVYGGDGQKNAIVAGCDTIEHGFGLDQEQVNMMAQKGLYYDPTLVRYTEPYMDDNDKKRPAASTA